MAMIRLVITSVFFLLTSASWGQVNRYMVFFKDKQGNGYTSDAPQEFLSQTSINRRIKQGITIKSEDLPVTESYVQGVRDAGGNTFFKTKWMNGVLIQCNEVLIPIIQSLPYVDRVEFVAPNARLLNGGRKKGEFKTKELKTAASTQAQLQMIGLDEMHKAGLEGDNIIIAIFDGGFQGVNSAAPFQHIFNENRINLEASKDFITNSTDVFQYDDHGTEVFSVIAAYQDGFYTGGSYEANYQLYVTEDVGTEYRVEEYNWLFAAERADSAGVDVVNSSLGYYNFDLASMDYSKAAMNGTTTVVSRAAQMLADRGVIIVCSAGNEGGIAWQIITAPADAKDVLAIGNVNNSGMRAGSSSIGPSADGRIKPDVAALGVNTSVIRPNGTLGASSGTSLASPLVASLAAGLWQRYPELSNLEIMDAIRKSASQSLNPDNLLGYGIPNFKAVVNYLERTEQKNTFEVYPNPVSRDTITISPIDPTQISSCKIELVNAQGQVVHEKTVNFSWAERIYTASVSTLSAGIYFVRIWWGDKKFTYKIIKL